MVQPGFLGTGACHVFTLVEHAKQKPWNKNPITADGFRMLLPQTQTLTNHEKPMDLPMDLPMDFRSSHEIMLGFPFVKTPRTGRERRASC